MSDSSSDENGSEWVFYRERPEWSDVTPVPQEEGPRPVVSIAYGAKFRDVYDYMRAVLKSGEVSERALALTKDALQLNPANYTVWQYRRHILKSLGKDLREELDYIGEVIECNPKNYQVWHHRMVIVEWLNDAIGELEFIEKMLSLDPKNYHAWKHRQWVLIKFSLFENELQYTHQLIEDDIRNNSAWNQRYFVINFVSDFDEKVVHQEIEYALNAILKVAKNESAWNYLRGLLIHIDSGLLESKVVSVCEHLYAQGNKSIHLLAYLVDMALEKLQVERYEPSEETNVLLERAKKICKELAETYDRVRRKYWLYVLKAIENKANFVL
uniref:Protein farnesyltransferase/geranylgeranyltransferase type-1 subunit alpha n=1 Tax=Panstrongylus megistus TaxID=65343 RepID=A0A069DSV1_9HEMI